MANSPLAAGRTPYRFSFERPPAINIIEAIMMAIIAPVGNANAQHDGFHEPIQGNVQHQLQLSQSVGCGQQARQPQPDGHQNIRRLPSRPSTYWKSGSLSICASTQQTENTITIMLIFPDHSSYPSTVNHYRLVFCAEKNQWNFVFFEQGFPLDGICTFVRTSIHTQIHLNVRNQQI